MQAMEHYAKFDVHAAQRHVAPAVLGFFRSVALGQASGQQHPTQARSRENEKLSLVVGLIVRAALQHKNRPRSTCQSAWK